ncbi:MAG: hypothetical protein GY874_18485 [Desulfobacteraceae bacterium]|nr:hypothetical protein [Desulfobacteraceae bacterium]
MQNPLRSFCTPVMVNVRQLNNRKVKDMGIMKELKEWKESHQFEITVKFPFITITCKRKDDVADAKNRMMIFQLGYVYGQYCVTKPDGLNDVNNQIKTLWKKIPINPPSLIVPKHLRKISGPSLIGEVVTFLKRSLNKRRLPKNDIDLCLLGFTLFCQPLTKGSSETAELVVKYAKAAPISNEEQQQLRNECVATDIGTKEGAMNFFNKWTRLIEKNL